MSNLFFEVDTEGVDVELSTMLDNGDCCKSPVRSLPDADEIWCSFENPELDTFVTPVRRPVGNSPMLAFDYGQNRIVRCNREKFESSSPERKVLIEKELRKSVGL
jgi:hypothetical protein